jgi:hypothetical protein
VDSGGLIPSARCAPETGIGVGFLPHDRHDGPARFFDAFAVQYQGMDESFPTANLLQWLPP